MFIRTWNKIYKKSKNFLIQKYVNQINLIYYFIRVYFNMRVKKLFQRKIGKKQFNLFYYYTFNYLKIYINSIGEEGLMKGRPRKNTVIAIEETDIIHIGR